jgi:G:T/U-mismatch repair DNA glycosylase
MNDKKIERHPLGFFLPENTRVLMLGSFPPPRERWSMNFYYPNFQNDMWRIMGLVFFSDREHFIAPSGKGFDEEKVRAFCLQKGIGLGDTAIEVIRLKQNASDRFLEVVRPADIHGVLRRIPACRAIVITGQKSMDTLLSVIPAEEATIGSCSSYSFEGREIRIYRMPSSSRAYPKPLSEKAADYGNLFRRLDML